MELIEEVSEDLFMITLPIPADMEHVHIFALVHHGKVSLFDAGLNTPEAVSGLEEALHTVGKSFRDVDRIFITHAHADHYGIAGLIREHSGASIHISATGRLALREDRRGDLLLTMTKTFYRRHGLSEKEIAPLAPLFLEFAKYAATLEADDCRDLGLSETVGGKTIEVIPTPGHTAGHVCFFFREEGILLSGDHILPDITPNLSPDPHLPDFRPLPSFLHSLALVQALPAAKTFPAHGAPFSDVKGRVEEIKEHHRERKDRILAAVQNGRDTTFLISQDIFGRNLGEFDRFLAVNETYVHLIELEKEGRIKSRERKGLLFYAGC